MEAISFHATNEVVAYGVYHQLEREKAAFILYKCIKGTHFWLSFFSRSLYLSPFRSFSVQL